MTAPSQTRPNPYVGPRAFHYGEKLYGRDREVMELLDLLIAERIVLLYSPSGAGKTSLIQAALIPELEQEDFQVLPVMRVNLESPTVGQVGNSSNRYVLSLLLSLEEALPADQQTPLAELADMTLADYLNRRPRVADEPDTQVLIFDQFGGNMKGARYLWQENPRKLRVLNHDALGYEKDWTRTEGARGKLSKALTWSTAIINVPVIKDHDLGGAGITCAIKNMVFGCVEKPHLMHHTIATALPHFYAREEIRGREPGQARPGPLVGPTVWGSGSTARWTLRSSSSLARLIVQSPSCPLAGVVSVC